MIPRLDLLITRHVIGRILSIVFLFFCLILLVEWMDTGRFDRISSESGDAVAWLAIVTGALRWAIKTLSVTVLFGAIIALLEFQSHRELTIMKVAGLSVWRIMLGPLIIIAIFGALVAFVFDDMTTRVNREINPTPPGDSGGIARGTSKVWLSQNGLDGEYYIEAQSANLVGTLLRDVVIFPVGADKIRRIEAERARFRQDQWQLDQVRLTNPDGNVTEVENYVLRTNSNEADLRLTVGSTEDFTFFELRDVVKRGLNDPLIQASAVTRLLKLAALPLMLVGSLLIAFAFTAGYPRDKTYGRAVLYGIIVGFVVFVITEMADRAGSSGALAPALATWGPAVVAVVTGLSVLLRKEDGRA